MNSRSHSLQSYSSRSENTSLGRYLRMFVARSYVLIVLGIADAGDDLQRTQNSNGLMASGLDIDIGVVRSH